MSPLPPPPAVSFASDNFAGVCPEVLDALVAANTPAAPAYGADRWSTAAIEALRDLFGVPVEVLWCWGGTGANVVGLASVLRPFEAIVCTDTAHVFVDECGAPTRLTGCPMLPVAHVDGKLTPAALESQLHGLGVEHHPQPGVVTISQSTELGTVYSAAEIAALAELAHRHGLRLHVDGARLANAVVATGTSPAAMLVDTGVDVLTFGATKNGAMYGEAVVFLRPDLAGTARYTRKLAGQLPSKSRFVAAQFLALLEDDLWLANARRANAAASLLHRLAADLPGVDVGAPPACNALFPRLPAEHAVAMRDWSFFWDWDEPRSVYRWMTSFATTDADVEAFVAGIRAILGAGPARGTPT